MSLFSLIACCTIEPSIMIGSTEKSTKIVQISVYLQESRMNQRVKRQPRKWRMIWRRLNLAKMGGTLVPISIKRNSRKQRPIIV